MPPLRPLTIGTLILTLLPLTGCGGNLGLGGGAYTPSNVTLIVSNTAGGEAAPVETTEAAAPAMAGFGTVRGKVVIDGAAPTLAMLLGKGETTKDAICAVNGVPNESVIADASGGLANVFIYLKKAPAGVQIPAAPTQESAKSGRKCFTRQGMISLVRCCRACRASGYRESIRVRITATTTGRSLVRRESASRR